MPSEPWPAAGQKSLRLEALANPLGLFEAIETGGGEQNGVDLALGEFAQARVDVAAELDGLDVGAEGVQLRAATLAAGADDRALRQRGKAVILHRDEHIARVDARRRGGQRERLGQFGGQILERVHGEIDAALGERLFDFLGEHALGADLGEGDFLQPVAGGLDDLDFDGVALRAQKRGDVVGLPERELRAAAADAQIHLPPTALVSLCSALFTSLQRGCAEGDGSD